MLLIDSLAALIGSSIALIGLGLVTGFSPTLYVTQAGIALRSRGAASHMLALIVGVFLGTVILGTLFQFFQPQFLIHLFSINIGGSVINAWFNIAIGIICVIGGITYTRPVAPVADKQEILDTPNTRYMAITSFAALKTILSASGAAAIFLASNIITETDVGLLGKIILAALYLATTIFPFGIIFIIGRRSPQQLTKIKKSMASFVKKINYRRLVGIVVVIIGCAIIAHALAPIILPANTPDQIALTGTSSPDTNR
jgi:uncharacterized protein YjeT (DUF2065 family)